MDFRFNHLRNVKKVNWKQDAPWYCEVRDGLNWFGYCLNEDCETYRSLFVVNRGFGIFKLEQELNEFSCPVCSQVRYDLRNVGFVNCEWAMKGSLKRDAKAKIFADGQTFDGKLYTFKEMDYQTEFDRLNLFVKKNEEQNENISSCSSISGSAYNDSSRRPIDNKRQIMNKDGSPASG